MKEFMICKATDRIRLMEDCFDELQKAAKNNPAVMLEDPLLRTHLQSLTQYYESGQWLHDYELDEQGLLPQNLKRGILAQDAIYDFLEMIKHTD